MERQATQLTHTGTAAHESRRLIDEAARWYERAWVAGVAQAATALGRLHRAKGDQLEADSWFAKAAADGLGTAQNQDDFTDIGFSGAGVRQGRLAAELETPADGAAASCRAPRDIVRPASELAGPEHDVSAAPASPKMSQDEKKSVEPEREQQKKDFAAMLSWMGEKLREDVKEVRLSSRLTTSPACIVGDTHDITPTLEKMYRAMGHDVPSPKRILELNPAHPLVAGLRKAHEQDADSDVLVETAELLYGMALLAEGGELDDPSRFTRLLADRLARTL